MKLKRRLSSKKTASKWSGDTSKGSAGIFENYKPKGIAPKFGLNLCREVHLDWAKRND